MSVDKEHLAKVLVFAGQSIDFALGQKFEEEFRLKSITVEGLGTISIPVSAADIRKVKKLSEPVSYECGNEVASDDADADGWRIDGSDVIGFSPPTYLRSELPNMMTEILSHMHIDADDVEAQLDKLMLFEKGGSFKCDKSSVNDSGLFGMMIVQIPVQGGYQGGKFLVEHENLRTTFDHSANSDESGYVTVLYSDCSHELQTITKGFQWTLVFDLYWKKSAVKNYENLPTLLKTLTELKDTLKPWEGPEAKSELLAIPLEHKYTKKSLNFKCLKGKDRLVAQALKAIDFICVHLAILNKTISGTPNEDLDHFSRPLTDESGFGDDDVRDVEEDELLSENRQSDDEEPKELKAKTKIKMKPVLTPVKVGPRSKTGKENELRKRREETKKEQKKGRMADESPPVYTTEQWIDVDDRQVAIPGLEIKVPDELVGEETEVFDPQSPDREKCEGSNGNHEGGRKLEFWYRRAVVVIWHRRQTFDIACRAGIDPALEELEQTLETGRCPVEESLAKLQRVIWFCRQNPNKVWRVDRNQSRSKGRGERACRLLKLCTKLQAATEGLDVLKLLGTEFKKDSKSFYGHNESFFYVGVQSEDVAAAVADFVQWVGWSSTSLLVSKMFSFVHCPRLEQIGKFASLAVELLERDCIDATIAVGSKTMQLLLKTDLHRLREVCKNGISSCAVMVMRLEGHPKTSSKQRINSFVTKIKSMNAKQLIQFMAEVQQSAASSLKKMAACAHFYLELCKLVAAHIDAPGVVVEVMKCYLWLEESSVVQPLIELISQNSLSSGNSVLLQTVLASQQSWNQPKTPTGDFVYDRLTKIRMAQLKRLKQPQFTWEQPNATMKDHPKVEKFLRSAEREFVYSNFTGVENARQFVDRYFAASGLRYGYSARATVGGKGRTTHVVITKTKDVFDAAVRDYRQQQAELKNMYASGKNREVATGQPEAKRLKTEVKEPLVVLD